MAYTALSIPTSPTASSVTREISIKERDSLHRSHSGKDLNKLPSSTLRRSYSDNHLCSSINRVQATSVQPKLKTSHSMGIFPFQLPGSIIPNSLRSFLFDQETVKDMNMEKDINAEESPVEESNEQEKLKRANWIERLMEISYHWRNRQQQESIPMDRMCHEEDKNDKCDYDDDERVCIASYNSEEEEEEEEGGQETAYNRDSFPKFLVRVPWSDTKLISQLACLSNMSYAIPDIKAQDLSRYYGLQFKISSLQKKEELAMRKEKLDQEPTCTPVASLAASNVHDSQKGQLEHKRSFQPSVAYEIAASAASYVQSQGKDQFSLGTKSNQDNDSGDLLGIGDIATEEAESSRRVYKSEVAAYVAASTMTAVVAASEREKQEAARDLQSFHSSPCEWFVCDDPNTYTRFFVIQGSDSLASWQANLFFEPTKFEGTDVLVHRGIYEAAKGLYEQFMPEIMEHLSTYGERAKLQFTGHSLGGSLSLLVHLMLLTRKVVKPSTLRPVVTFGSPFIFCGGHKILDELGLNEDHILCVMMHRDIVPRAFSCNYPNHVTVVLKRLNGTFRSHPCLVKNKLLYSPIGKLFILQPDEMTSPGHPLLPPGSALYALEKTKCGYSSSVLKAFLNQPHPLETLSDPTAYGSGGTILRDHDSSNYAKAVNQVLKQHTKLVVRRVRKQRNLLWSLLTSPSPYSYSHEHNLDRGTQLKKEIMTGV